MQVPLEKQLSEVLLKLQGYSVDSIEEVEYKGRKQIQVSIKSSLPLCCPICKTELPIYDTRTRYIYHASILGRAIVLNLKRRRVNCPRCGVKTEKQTIAENKKRHSKHLECCVLEHTVKLDNKSTANLLGLSPSTVYRIDKAGLIKLEEKLMENTPKMEHISIDEVAHKKYHHYATVLTNQEDSKVIDIYPGKSKESALALFKKYSDKLTWLETVAMDFSHSYISATKDYFAEHYIVFDRFHLSQYVNRCLEKVRREIQRDMPDDIRYIIKKHTRWLILRREHNMTQWHIDRLEQLKHDNEQLFEAYLIKEDLLSIFDKDVDRYAAKIMLTNWCNMASKSPYQAYRTLAKSIRNKIHILLNWFVKHITNAKAEAVNNIIKTLIRRAYGYKDFDYFRLKVLQRCGYLMKGLTHYN
ncbi:MAG TPA: ISL3 family transposase [Candidatus Cloacimonetes bacterium]|nr:ISL3 family transposase [Candidatus Cloacimonadota bacterium]